MGWETKARAAAALIATILLGHAAGADPLAIRVGWVVTPGHLTPLIEALGHRHPEMFKHLGKSYTLEAIHFAGTTPQIQALGDQGPGHRRAVAERVRAGDHQRASRRARRSRRGRRTAMRAISASISWSAPTGRSRTSRTSRAGASPPTRSARPATRRCARCSASTGSRTAISPLSRPTSPTCRQCSKAARST